MDNPALNGALALTNGSLSALVSPYGAELLSLRHQGVEWLWQGDEQSWPRRAPLLFPFCGRLHQATLHVDGQSYPNQPIHGFAPTSTFTMIGHAPDKVRLGLHDTAYTRMLYPYRFDLVVEFSLQAHELVQTIHCANNDERVLPYAIGFHPGFAWPLPGQTQKADHIIRFAKRETESVALPNANGLMAGDRRPNPVEGDRLTLDDTLFEAGSVIFDRLKSRALWFGVPGQKGLWMGFDTPYLVLWRWPGPGDAAYLCIEPWAGLPDPQGFADDFTRKPGINWLEPGKSRSWTLRLRPNI